MSDWDAHVNILAAIASVGEPTTIKPIKARMNQLGLPIPPTEEFRKALSDLVDRGELVERLPKSQYGLTKKGRRLTQSPIRPRFRGFRRTHTESSSTPE